MLYNFSIFYFLAISFLLVFAVLYIHVTLNCISCFPFYRIITLINELFAGQ